MKTYNDEFYEVFTEISDLLAILGENRFKIIAYGNAARLLKDDTEPITKKNASVADFKKLPKVGDALAEKMMEYIETGKVEYLEKLRRQIPEAVRDLLKIPGLGPNRVRELFINLGVKNKKDLIKAAKDGSIEELPGFGDKLVENILAAIESGQEKKKRHERKDIEPMVKKVVKILKTIKSIKQIEVAGSYRRGSKTIGDIDILTEGNSKVGKKILEAVEKEFEKTNTLADGETKVAFVIFPDNLQVDIRFVPKESWGAALLYFTGSKDFNVKMRKIAIEKGYLLNEYGLFDGGEYIAGKTEKEVFEKLEVDEVVPEKRR